MNKANVLAQAILLLLLLCLASNIWAGLPDDGAIAKTFCAKAQRIESRIMKLAEFGKNPEGGVPLEVGLYLAGQNGPQIEVLQVNEKANIFTIKVASEPENIILDPNTWILMEADFSKSE